MATTARTTGNTTTSTSRKSAGTAKTVFSLVVIGAIVLLLGFGAVSGSHASPTVVTCDNQTMQPGDTCVSYTNGARTGSESYDQVRADHAADIQRDKTLGPLLIVVGGLLIGGALVSAVAAASRGPRPSHR